MKSRNIIGALALLLSVPAQAVIVQGTFSGAVTFVRDTYNNGLNGPVAIGDAMTGTFSYDTGAVVADLSSDPNFGDYQDPTHQTRWANVTMLVNGVSYTSTSVSGSDSLDRVQAFDERFTLPDPSDLFRVFDEEKLNVTDTNNIQTSRQSRTFIDIGETIGELFDSDALPLGPISWTSNERGDRGDARWELNSFQRNIATNTFIGERTEALVQFRVNSMSLTSVSAVPVPAAVWLFGSGLLGLIGIARRKKTTL